MALGVISIHVMLVFGAAAANAAKLRQSPLHCVLRCSIMAESIPRGAIKTMEAIAASGTRRSAIQVVLVLKCIAVCCVVQLKFIAQKVQS